MHRRSHIHPAYETVRNPGICLSALFLLILVATCAHAKEDGRIAWVIGNASYQELPPVTHAVSDARLVADGLRLAGFEVRDAYETDGRELREIWQDIERSVNEGACSDCVFYFSGHAKATRNEQYFLPLEFREDEPPDFYPSFLQLILALNQHESDDGASVLFIDVGRTPSRSRSATFLNFDLSATSVSRTALLFSYREDFEREGSSSAGNSDFAVAVTKELQKPGLELSDFYRNVAATVREASNGETWPRLIGTLPRAFYFNPHNEDEVALFEGANGLRAARVMVRHEDGRLVPTYTTSHALLIGASDYENDAAWSDLPGARSDIEAVAKVLEEKHGFNVTRVIDPTKEALERALADFAVKQGSEENARLIVYYAGHGHTHGAQPLQTGWIVPVDTPDPKKDPSGFFQTALSMDEIKKYSLVIRAKHVLWVFDSCFSGQLIETLRGDVRPGNWESFLQTGKVRRVITSGSADQLVPDRSVFASYFVAALSGRLKAGDESGLLTGNQFSHFLKGQVIQDRGDEQTPQFGTIKLFGAEEGDIIFHVEPGG